MDKNTVIGMLLMALVLFGFMFCHNSNKENNEEPTTTTQTTQNNSAENNVAVPELTPSFESEMIAIVEKYHVDNLEITTDTLGVKHLAGLMPVAGSDTLVNVANAFNPNDLSVTPAQRQLMAETLDGIKMQRVKYKDFADVLDGTPSKPITINKGKMAITFNPKGGRIESVILNDYDVYDADGKPVRKVELMNPSHSNYYFKISTGEQVLSTADMTFEPSVNSDSTQVTMALNFPGDAWMKFVYTIEPDEYIVKLDVKQQNMTNSALPANITNVGFNWNMDMERNEIGRSFEENKSALYYKLKDDSPDDLSATDEDSEDITGAVKWVAFKNQFFSSIVIPRENFTSANMKSVPIKDNDAFGDKYLKKMSLEATLDYSPKSTNAIGLDFYFGPNSYTRLGNVAEKQLGYDDDLDLQKLVPLGWGIFGWINRFIVIPLFNFLGSFITSYGLIILILTIIIKIILFPFTYNSYMSQAKMRVLAPEIKEINEKYPGQENAMKRQQETMKLYSKAGASPFSGCLPMLLQLPVLIALFTFFPSAIELRGQSFLWAHNLAAPDYICSLPFRIPFYGDHVSLFCLLMTITNIVYSRITMASNPSAGMGGMKWMTYLMPIMFLFFFNDYASGLSYYYFISLLITIGQTYICRMIVNEDKVRQQMLENAKKPKKKSGFMARLEEAQKRQEAMMREQAKQRAKKNR